MKYENPKLSKIITLKGYQYDLDVVSGPVPLFCTTKDRLPVVYVSTAKSACSTTKALLYYMSLLSNGCSTPDKEFVNSVGSVHDAVSGPIAIWKNAYWRPLLRAKLASLDVLFFTTVRNPYCRLVSGFKNKVVDNSDATYAKFRQVFRRHCNKYDELSISDKFNYFCEFMGGRLLKYNGNVDQHFAPQYLVTCANILPYDHVVKVENFENQIEEVFLSLGLSNWNKEFIALKRNIASIKDDVIIGESAASMIREYYELDFQLFGYDKETPEKYILRDY